MSGYAFLICMDTHARIPFAPLFAFGARSLGQSNGARVRIKILMTGEAKSSQLGCQRLPETAFLPSFFSKSVHYSARSKTITIN
jgi:hypothetical protein